MSKKIYVKVNASFSPDGVVLPRSFYWTDGHLYKIDSITDARMAASKKVGGCGMRYTISVNGRDSYIFREDDRWFVEEKETSC